MIGTPGRVEHHILHYGETIEVDVKGIGVLRNYVTRVNTAAVSYFVSVRKRLEQQDT